MMGGNYLKHLHHHPLLLLSIFLLLSSTFLFSTSHAEGISAEDEEAIREWKEKRSQFSVNNAEFPLAANRTRRIDPSDNFKYYEAGWDVAQTHYLLSLVYSGAPLIAAGAIWFLGVIVFAIIVLCCACFCKKNNQEPSYSRKVSVISLIFLVLFLLLAISGASLLYSGQENFQRATKDVMGEIMERVIKVVDILDVVMINLDGALKMKVGGYTLPDQYRSKVEQVREMVAIATDIPEKQGKQIFDAANKTLEGISYSLKVVAGLMLALIVLGLICSACGRIRLVYFLFFIGWILVTVTFLLCSISLIVHNGVGDTCVAMEDWLEYPQNRTVLTKLIPCVDEATAEKAREISRNTSSQIVNVLNQFVENVANHDQPQDGQAAFFYNQSGPPLPRLCNPYNQDMSDRQCDPQEIPLDNASQGYQSFVCKSTSEAGVCNSEGRLSPDLYNQMMIATNMSHTLREDGPFLINLADCTFIAETFVEIKNHHCHGMVLHTDQIYIGLIFLSLSVVFSVIFWVAYAKQRQRQISPIPNKSGELDGYSGV